MIISSATGGITIPKENCRLGIFFVRKIVEYLISRWLGATDWDTSLRCADNQVAVGSCSGGGGFGHKAEWWHCRG